MREGGGGLRRRAALRTGEGGGKGAHASARRGDTYGTKAAMSKSPYPNGRGRNLLLEIQNSCYLRPHEHLGLRQSEVESFRRCHSPKLTMREAASGAECAKCNFPHRKDYTCAEIRPSLQIS